VLSDTIVGDANRRHGVLADSATSFASWKSIVNDRLFSFGGTVLLLAGRFLTFQAEILKVIDSLSVDQFDRVVHRAPVVFAQVALGGDVIVLGRATNESFLLVMYIHTIR